MAPETPNPKQTCSPDAAPPEPLAGAAEPTRPGDGAATDASDIAAPSPPVVGAKVFTPSDVWAGSLDRGALRPATDEPAPTNRPHGSSDVAPDAPGSDQPTAVATWTEIRGDGRARAGAHTAAPHRVRDVALAPAESQAGVPPAAALPSPVHSQSGWWAILFQPFVLAQETTSFIFVSALDLFTTYLLLAWPGSPGYEANRIAVWFFRRWNIQGLVFYKFVVITVAILCCEALARHRRAVGRMILIAATLVTGGVAFYGALLVAKHLITI
jgi:hypothetical protein